MVNRFKKIGVKMYFLKRSINHYSRVNTVNNIQYTYIHFILIL